MAEGAPADEESRAETTGGVDRRAIYRDSDEVYERESKSDDESRDSGIAGSSGDCEDHEDEEEGQDDLGDEGACGVGSDHRGLTVPVSAEADAFVIARGGVEHAVESSGADDPGDDLSSPMADRVETVCVASELGVEIHGWSVLVKGVQGFEMVRCLGNHDLGAVLQVHRCLLAWYL